MIDDDLDAPEDFEKEVAEKPSLREIWENNPALKLVAIVVGVSVLLGGYMIFSGKSETATKSVIAVSGEASAKQIPGEKIADPAYRKALEQVNKQKAEQAIKTGGSAMPLPIAVSKGAGLQIPQAPQAPQSDVLAEWRRVASEEQMKMAQKKIQMESAPPPAAVPVVKPIRPQMVIKADPKEVQLLSQQMRVILKAQNPLAPQTLKITNAKSAYERMKKQEEASAKNTGSSSGGGSDGSSATANAASSGASSNSTPGKVIVAAGTVDYAQLLNELDSDVPGPVLAEVLSGPFSGGRLIGKVSKQNDYMVINFDTVVKDTVSYKVDAVALDENTTLAGQATSVDHHYMMKVVLPAAAAFLTGYSNGLSQTQQTQTSTSGVGITATNAQPTAKQSIYKGVQSASQSVGSVFQQLAEEPTTVIIAKGTTMGVFFTKTVTTKDAQ